MAGSRVVPTAVFMFNSHVLVQFTRPSVTEGMSEAAPLLFLDVDGVLHHSQATTPSEFFHPRCMANLQRIVHSTECKLVLSSFWRTDPEMVERLNAALAECDIAPVASSTRQHAPPDLSLPAKERLSLSVIRAREISDWRQQGSRREASWAVLDDLQMSAELPSNGGHPACYELEDHLVNTCPLHGMTDAHVRAAIAMLTEWEGVPAGDVMDATKLVCPLCEKEGRGPPEPVEAEPSVPLASQAGVRAGAAASVAPGSMPSHEKHAGGPSHEKHAGGAQRARTLPSTRATARGIATDVPSMLPRLEPRLSITATSAETVLARIAVQPTADLAVCAADSVLSSDGAWREGVQLVSASKPRLLLYPNFLSPLESDHLMDLCRWAALEAAAAASVTAPAAQAVSWDSGRPVRAATSGRTTSFHLPAPSDDATIRAVEERCAAVTGIPIHPDEEPLGARHTSPSTWDECRQRYCTALHVDTNQGGHHRCATVLIYLHDVDVPVGGETRFPLVGAGEPSELREAARRIADLGVTAFSPDSEVSTPPLALRKTLLDAAETSGLHVKPKKGTAAVFWTQTEDGLDPYSWHAGARLPPEAADGKVIVQKFKSLPAEWRPGRAGEMVRLPAALAPPVV